MQNLFTCMYFWYTCMYKQCTCACAVEAIDNSISFSMFGGTQCT